jgi:8-oxo-dGTP pyrophosphatase MutT (NUDIX family)
VNDPRFWLLREALASYASDPGEPPAEEAHRLQAGVALLVRGRNELDLLLIKRARHPGDPWSGHMALPGGRREAGDASLRETAIRETREETGVDLGPAMPLGALPTVSPASRQLPDLTIHPFVFGVTAETPARAASPEVDAIHWTPVAELRRPDAVRRVTVELPGGSRTFPCFRVGGEVVWGLTYRILTRFLERVPTPPTRR